MAGYFMEWVPFFGTQSSQNSGAIDVIAIKRGDGTIVCSPFHVKLNKGASRRSRKDIVKLSVNGEASNIFMKIGHAGEAFFVERTGERVGRELRSSPPNSPISGRSKSMEMDSSVSNNNQAFPSKSKSLLSTALAVSIMTEEEEITHLMQSKRERTYSDMPAISLSRAMPMPAHASEEAMKTAQQSAASEGMATSPTITSSLLVNDILSAALKDSSSSSHGVVKDRAGSESMATAAGSINTATVPPAWSWTWGQIPVRLTEAAFQIVSRAESKLSVENSLPSEPQQLGCNVPIPASEMLQDQRHCRVWCAIYDKSDVMFALCGHILAQEAGAPEPPPVNTDHLMQILQSYSVSKSSDKQTSDNQYQPGSEPGADESILNKLLQDSSLVIAMSDHLWTAGVLHSAVEHFCSSGSAIDQGFNAIFDQSIEHVLQSRAARPAEQPLWVCNQVSSWGCEDAAAASATQTYSSTTKLLQTPDKFNNKSSWSSTMQSTNSNNDTPNNFSTPMQFPFVDDSEQSMQQQHECSLEATGDARILGNKSYADLSGGAEASQAQESSVVKVETAVDARGNQDCEDGVKGMHSGTGRAVAAAELCEEHLSLQDIAMEDILPGPAGGNFYESDTDSYQSLSLDEGEGTATASTNTGTARSCAHPRRYRYRKVLIPSKDQLQELSRLLKEGENELVFELEGSPPLRAQLFLWPEDAKIVVSDIEGAITVSKANNTVWGFFPGGVKTSVHDDVLKLLNNIACNGYHILYISQQSSTAASSSKESLVKAVANCGEARLPPGPIIRSPESLVQSDQPRSDVFKAVALRGIRSLFPLSHSSSVYYASFGTRPCDTVAFARSGVPESRNFLVKANGEIRNSIRVVKSTYSQINTMVDAIFPPVADANTRKSKYALHNATMDDSFGDYNYWSLPVGLVTK